MPLLTFFLLYQLLRYSNFKTQLSQLLAEKDHEKDQPVKNVDTQEKAARKDSVSPLQYQWTSSNLKALTWSFLKKHQYIIIQVYPFLQCPLFVTFHFSVLYFIELCVCVYAMKHFNTVKAKHPLQVLTEEWNFITSCQRKNGLNDPPT